MQTKRLPSLTQPSLFARRGLATLGILLAGASLSLSVNAASLDNILERGEIRIAIANEIPYGYVDMNGEPQGAGPEVAKHLASQLGIEKIHWVTTNFGGLIPGLRANHFDMVAAEMAILPQRCDQVAFSEPNSSYGEGLLVAAGNPDNIHSFEHFADNKDKVAIMAGADQLEMLQALGVPSDQMVTISNNADAIATITAGHASAYAATSLTVGELANKSKKVEAAEPFDDPVINQKPVRSWGAFTFKQGADDLVAAFDAELAKFKKTSQWHDILQKYGFSEQDIEQSFAASRQTLCGE